MNLDEQLDDFSAASVERQKRFCEGMRVRLAEAEHPQNLSPEERDDAAVIRNQIGRHATPETYMCDAKRDLAEACALVKTKNLLTLGQRHVRGRLGRLRGAVDAR